MGNILCKIGFHEYSKPIINVITNSGNHMVDKVCLRCGKVQTWKNEKKVLE